MGTNKAPIYLTREGAAKLKVELAELRGPKRDALAKRLRHAVQQGDLSENADYISSKEEQAFLEGRILELETILREAVVVDPPQASDKVALGTTVVVAVDGGSPETYQLVGMKEADPRRGKITHESPIGRALMGRRVGDTVEAVTPGGTLRLRVLEIRSSG
ncbi:MAG TPA: transcription elongation factor GreA [Anaerolineales bacterium]|nr:transcription elongation factor GreA [Anaerolineales bacterium]